MASVILAAKSYKLLKNAGTPEGAVTGNVGWECIDTTNGKHYIKGSGAGTNTGWVDLALGGSPTGSAGGDLTGTYPNPDIAAGVITATEIASSLKPSGTAATTDESLRRLGTGSTHAAAGDDSRFPTAGQKNALAGTAGTPGTGNEYVTTSDSRNSNARTPTAHKTSHATGGSDALTPSDIGAQASDTELTALAGLTSAANKVPYFTGSGTAALADFSAAGRALVDDADAAAQRTTLGLGTAAVAATGDFDAAGAAAAAQAASQPLDADLTAIAALTTTSFGRSVLTQADAAALRTLAGLVIGTDVQAYDADLAALAGLTSAADKLPYFTGSGSAAVTGLSSFIRTLLDDPDAATALATLGTDASSATRTPTDGTVTAAKVAAALKPSGSAAAGDEALRALGTSASTAAAGNDSRLSDARTPTAHASTHKPGGTDALMSSKRDAGTSASGTATTKVAEILADASSQLIGWTIMAAQTNAANTQMKVIITYSDATTITDTSVAATATTIMANHGGIERTAAGAHIAQVAGSTKAVTGIRVETAGTGTGTRSAVISATQVPL